MYRLFVIVSGQTNRCYEGDFASYLVARAAGMYHVEQGDRAFVVDPDGKTETEVTLK